MDDVCDDDDTCVVAEWLHTLDLIQYTQAFIDNGYDDLEICKQIGDPDLDAIGVELLDHRVDILNAVTKLNEQGTSHLYYILENRNYEEQRLKRQRELELVQQQDETKHDDIITDEYAEGRKAFVTFPKLHLCAMVRDKLAIHGITLTQAPFINQDGSLDCQALEDLALRFAADLRTHPQDVLDRLYDLLDIDSSASEQEVDVDSNARHDGYLLYSVCNQGTRSVPPPLPVYRSTSASRQTTPLSPPVCASASPSSSSRNSSFSSRTSRHASPSAVRRSPGCHDSGSKDINAIEEISDHAALLDCERNEKQFGTISKIIGTIRGRPPKKYKYKKVQGDLNAGDITMSDEERIQLMLLVKDGKLSKDQAVDAVKMYETERKRETQGVGYSNSAECASSQNRKKSATRDTTIDSCTQQQLPVTQLQQQQQQLLYEGSGTPLYSAVQGVRNRITESVGLFTSPKRGSPNRKSHIESDFKSTQSPKNKKKGLTFSSPFSRRKKSSKDLWESPKISLNSLQNDSGVFVSPSASRHGSFTLTHDTRGVARRQSPVLISPCDSPLHQQETFAVIHNSPLHTSSQSQSSPKYSPKSCDIYEGKSATKLVTFQSCRNSSSSRNTTGYSVTQESANSSVRGQCEVKQRSRSHSQCSSQRSSSIEHCNHLQSNSYSSLNKSNTAVKGYHTGGGGAVGRTVTTQKCSISPKRRNSPTDCQVNPQSSKRQHFSTSPELICDATNDQLSSADPGSAQFGSNSTMSVGSETSPVCTVERKTLTESSSKKQLKKTVERQRRRSHSFSTADEYLSSDQEESRDSKRNNPRDNRARRSLVETVYESGAAGDRLLIDNTKARRAIKLQHRDVTARADGAVPKRNSLVWIDGDVAGSRGNNGRRRGQTVNSILQRLGLAHFIDTFKENGITTVGAFSDLEDKYLDDLGIHNPEERAKLITAAQMISDFEDMTSESAPSSVCNSPNRHTHSCSTSPSPTSGLNLTATRKQLSLNDRSHSNSLLVPGSKCNLTRRSSSPLMTSEPLPLYENIDNFESAIPDDERLLTNTGCQCEFDANTDRVVHVDYDEEQRKYSKFYNSHSYPYQGHEAMRRKSEPKPKVPERTISLLENSSSNSSTSSTSLTPVKFKDASTQHGGILHMLMRSGSLVTSSPSPGCSKVKTADTAPLLTCSHSSDARASTLSKLCPQHRKRRQSSRRVAEAISCQLMNEGIDLTQQPYTSVIGECGIPPALVRRYAEELQIDLHHTATIIESLRRTLLDSAHKVVIPHTEFADLCLNPVAYEPDVTSVHDFLVSIGLPQYITLFQQNNIDSVNYLIRNVRDSENIEELGITNATHIKRLRNELKHLRQRNPLQEIGISLNQSQRTDSGYSTIDPNKSAKDEVLKK